MQELIEELQTAQERIHPYLEVIPLGDNKLSVGLPDDDPDFLFKVEGEDLTVEETSSADPLEGEIYSLHDAIEMLITFYEDVAEEAREAIGDYINDYDEDDLINESPSLAFEDDYEE